MGGESRAGSRNHQETSQEQQVEHGYSIPVTSSVIEPPKVTSTSHACHMEWKQKRRENEDTMTARCVSTSEDLTKALVPVYLLDTLRKYDWGTTADEVSEERIITELEAIISNVKNGTIADVTPFCVLKMNLGESDVQARVVKYFQRCEEIIMQHGLQKTFATAEGVKEKCKLLKKHLQPSALREEIDQHQRFHSKDSKSSDIALYKLMKAKALEQEKAYRSTTGRKSRPRPVQPTNIDDSKGSTKYKDITDQGKRRNPFNNKRPIFQDEETVKKKLATEDGNAASQPRTGCYQCGKAHWLRQCPDICEDAKDAILAGKRSKRKGDANFFA
ncbi:LOW QUALITY PROTEIN: Hypothetical protein PHPALM_8503 [Phytophthora palmivora]|uniref:CCHC-type domain-containing protein n=1 Tax=Phytophthora palmivora TaxID=4796 RepID=A0A2P4Y9P1_9STRA|nr:LOW QUALITY PROTEIN: Hypothetical protein PHPALM_8503 [Phytophthora palmivora]